MDDFYEWIEPKIIMLITLFLILFDYWGKSIHDGYSKWTVIRCVTSFLLYITVIYLFQRA